MNPSLSNSYNLFQRTNEEKFYYYYEENKIILFHFDKEREIKIYENGNITYNKNVSENDNTFNLTFLKNIEYNITIKDYSYYNDSNIYIQFFDEYEYVKPDLYNSSFLLFDNYDYKIELDISHIKLGEYITIFFTLILIIYS